MLRFPESALDTYECDGETKSGSVRPPAWCFRIGGAPMGLRAWFSTVFGRRITSSRCAEVTNERNSQPTGLEAKSNPSVTEITGATSNVRGPYTAPAATPLSPLNGSSGDLTSVTKYPKLKMLGLSDAQIQELIAEMTRQSSSDHSPDERALLLHWFSKSNISGSINDLNRSSFPDSRGSSDGAMLSSTPKLPNPPRLW